MTDAEIKQLIGESVLTIKGYVDALHEQVNIKIDTLDVSVNSRIDTLEDKVDTIESKVNTIIDLLRNGAN